MSRTILVPLTEDEIFTINHALTMQSTEMVLRATDDDCDPVVKVGLLSMRANIRSVLNKIKSREASAYAGPAKTTLKQQVDLVRELCDDEAGSLAVRTKKLRAWLGLTGYEPAFDTEGRNVQG